MLFVRVVKGGGSVVCKIIEGGRNQAIVQSRVRKSLSRRVEIGLSRGASRVYKAWFDRNQIIIAGACCWILRQSGGFRARALGGSREGYSHSRCRKAGRFLSSICKHAVVVPVNCQLSRPTWVPIKSLT